VDQKSENYGRIKADKQKPNSIISPPWFGSETEGKKKCPVTLQREMKTKNQQ